MQAPEQVQTLQKFL